MIDFLVQVADGWWRWMGPMSVQVTALVVLVALLDRLLCRCGWHQAAAMVWIIVLIKLAVPPTVTSPASIARLVPLPQWTAAPPVADTGRPALPRPDTESADAAKAQVGSGLAGTGAKQTAWSLRSSAFLVWLGGVLVLGSLAVWRARSLRREWLGGAATASGPLTALARQAAARIGLSRLPGLRLAHGVAGPAVVGWRRPVIVLPAGVPESCSRMQLEHVLLHELAHVKRRDPLVHLASLMAQVVYWFHPLVWLACRRLALLREVGCDQAVVHALGGAAIPYRDTLLSFARSQFAVAAELAFLPRRSQLLVRLEWLARPAPSAIRLRRAASAGLSLTLCATCLPMAPTISEARSPIRRPAMQAALTNDPEFPGPVPGKPDRTVLPGPVPGKPDRTVTSGPHQETTSLTRGPGCLPLRFQVYRALAEERRTAAITVATSFQETP